MQHGLCPQEAYREQRIHRPRRGSGGRHAVVCAHIHAHSDFLGNHIGVMEQRYALVSAKLISKPVPATVLIDTASDSDG